MKMIELAISDASNREWDLILRTIKNDLQSAGFHIRVDGAYSPDVDRLAALAEMADGTVAIRTHGGAA